MSWNNVIPAEILLGPVKLEPKEVDNPEVTIPEELVTDCLVKYKIDDYGMTSHRDHPAFAELRKVLNGQGYIEMVTNCVNGDRVTKRFIFNDFQLEVGDRFYCAGAWNTKMKVRKKNAEDRTD